MVSSAIMPDVKRAGRLALAFDVLKQGVAVCPQELLPEDLKKVLEPTFKTEVLYRSRGQDLQARLGREKLPNPRYPYKGLVSLFDGKTRKIEVNYGFRLAIRGLYHP